MLRQVITHLLVLSVGFAAGIYTLPLLIAPESPALDLVEQIASDSVYSGHFSRDREDSDALHWGEGELSIGDQMISFKGKLAPGPDYRLYFSPRFVETEADFMRLKPSMVEVGRIDTFENFIVRLPDQIDPARYNTAIVWCESFEQFITSARYSEDAAGITPDKLP